jgi:OOP family OmpA-OmpF porin
MKKLFAAAVSILALLTFSCSYSRQPVELNSSVLQPPSIEYGKYMTETQNVYVILDASSSMDQDFNKEQSKFMVSKIVTDRINKALPDDMKFSVLRTYGHSLRQSWSATDLIYKAEVHDKTEFSIALEGVKYAGGPSPLPAALKAVEKDIENVEGKIAILLISDGVQLDKGLREVTSIKSKYGDKVCFYTVFIDGGWKSEAMRGKSFMEHVARLGRCGFAVDVDKMDLNEFVKTVFLKRIPDSDGDGILDPFDDCKDTPTEAKVNAKGCWVLSHVLFDFDKYEIKEQYYAVLDEIARVMKANPDVNLRIDGHTDDIGMHDYNTKLSLKRAEEASKELIGMGIDKDRIDVYGYSFLCPTDSNATAEGRQNNRRVEMNPSRR